MKLQEDKEGDERVEKDFDNREETYRMIEEDGINVNLQTEELHRKIHQFIYCVRTNQECNKGKS